MQKKVNQIDHLNNERILASVGKKCTLGCIYCFVDNENYSPLPKIDTPNTSIELQELFNSVDIIQPSADVEFLLSPNYFSTLDRLVKHGKSISFATKLRISPQLASSLMKYHKILLSAGAILHISVSIVRLKDWQDLEIFAPDPKARVESLRVLYESGIPTTVSVRPLLPFITLEEIEEIVTLTHKYTYGYHSGPTYLTPALESYMIQKGLSFSSDIVRVEWLPSKPFMKAVFSPDLELHLKKSAEKLGLPLFANNIEVVQKLQQASLSKYL